VSQGKYASKILQIFHMEICKRMPAPLATNWKGNSTVGAEFDATIYRQFVGYLMYLVNTRPDVRYVVK